MYSDDLEQRLFAPPHELERSVDHHIHAQQDETQGQHPSFLTPQ